jgi:hypothetical protein
MSFPRRLSILFLLLLPLGLRAELALKPGEVLTYRVSWKGLHAGDITIAASSVVSKSNIPQLQVTTTTATRGLARMLYDFRAEAESLYDTATGRLLSTVETTKSGDRDTKVTTTFDYVKKTASYAEAKDAAPAILTMPAGDPQDLIMSLVQTRRWNLKPGEHQDALVLFGDDFYELTIHAERFEEVRTPLGTFNTLVLVPRMEKTPPKGMFKRGSAVRVWVSQDDRRLPVKFQVDFKFGAGFATLNAYEPPKDAAKPATPAPAPSATPGSDAKNPRP